MNTMRRRWGVGAFAAALALGCSAQNKVSPGALMLMLTTDAPAAASSLSFGEVTVVLDDSRSSGRQVRVFQVEPSDLPQTLTIAAKSEAGGSVTKIQVFAFDDEGSLRIFREAIVPIPSTGIQMLRMPLNVACDRVYPAGVCPPAQSCGGSPRRACADAETCVDGACQAVGVPEVTLPMYTDGAEGTCVAPGVRAQCDAAATECGPIISADACGEVKVIDCGACGTP